MNTPLRPYQAQILDELKHLSSIALFMGTGTGKTLTSLYRFQSNQTKKLLIVCPKSVVNQWGSVIEKELPQLAVLQFPKYSNSEEKNKLIKSSTYDVLIINFEIVSKLTNLMPIVTNDWTVIIDESHRMKSPKAIVTKFLMKLSTRTENRILLTATPTQGNYGGYVDYFTQLSFLGYLQMTYKEFEERYIRINRINFGNSSFPTPVIAGYKNTYEIDALLKRCARYYEARYGDFEPQHSKVMLPKTDSYQKLLKEKAYKDIMITNSARKRVALKTLTSGTITGQDMMGNHFNYVDNTTKIDWLSEFLEDTDEPVMILYQYNVELHQLEELMKKLKKKYIIVNGQTKDKFNEIKKAYNIVLGQFQAVSESLDGLQHRTHIQIFFSMPESSLTYKQAIGRIDRIGQEKVPMYYYLVMENTIDDRVYRLIEQKIEFSEDTLDKLTIEEEN